MSSTNKGKSINEHTITRTPLPNSSKAYTQGTMHPQIAVPHRQISLTNGKTMNVYDTSGPYTDVSVDINLEKGLNPIRRDWILARNDTEESFLLPKELRVNYPQHQPRKAKGTSPVSQLYYAKQGIITPEMEYIAIRESIYAEQQREANKNNPLAQERSKRLQGNSMGASIPEIITPEFVRDEIARGRAVMPLNINHPEIEPSIIDELKVYINYVNAQELNLNEMELQKEEFKNTYFTKDKPKDNKDNATKNSKYHAYTA